MFRRYVTFTTKATGLILMGLSLAATVQFVRGDLPNPLLLGHSPSTAPSDGIGDMFQWLGNLLTWMAGLGIYLGCGVLAGTLFNDLSVIAEIGWREFRLQQKAAEEEICRLAAVERARAKRRQLRDLAHAKEKPSSVVAILFGVIIGWLIFH